MSLVVLTTPNITAGCSPARSVVLVTTTLSYDVTWCYRAAMCQELLVLEMEDNE